MYNTLLPWTTARILSEQWYLNDRLAEEQRMVNVPNSWTFNGFVLYLRHILSVSRLTRRIRF